MSADGEYLARSVADRHNIVETSWRETSQNKSPQIDVPTNVKTTPNGGSFLLPISLITIFVIFFIGAIFKQLKSLKTFNEPFNELLISKHPQPSCYRCRFFNNNAYLKCAVHPCTVLTSQAKNCSDYWPQHQKDFFYH
jgi:hypothetical protein